MSTIRQLFRKDIRNRIGFILLCLIVYRIGSHIPIPGVNPSLLLNASNNSGMMGILNAFSGGSLSKFSIFALGIMPYITASIIIQLLSKDVIPTLTEWSKQGEYGQKKIKRLTRYMTGILALLQGAAMSFSFNRMYPGLVTNPKWTTYVFISIILAAGTIFLMLMGEYMTKKEMGNGISILIFAGIVASFPTAIQQLFTTEYSKDFVFLSIVKIVLVFLLIMVLIVASIYVLEANRKIPIQYAKHKSDRSHVVL